MLRWVVVALMLAGCAPQPRATTEAELVAARATIAAGRSASADPGWLAAQRENALRRGSLDPSIEPGPRRDFLQARQMRENELVERALSNAPDYQQAVRRAAVSNVDGEAALSPNPRMRSTRSREAAIAAEEGRLFDAVEQRRRSQLAQQARSQQAAMDEQARAACLNQGAQIDASMYNPRSLLNLEGAIASRQAAERCWQAYLAGRPNR